MNRLVRPVCFAFEPDVVSVFALISFGSTGAPTLNTTQCKGICNITRKTISITGDIANTSPTVSNVSSFAGLYVGMSITGTGIPAATTISAMTPGSGTITLSQNATATTATLAISVAGGQYVIQLGRQAGVQLDTYNKLLALSHNWDESGLQGGASTAASSPAAPAMILIGNQTAVRTVPPTVAGNLTDATITVQFGTLSGATFVAADPATGEKVRLSVKLCRSGAV